MRYRDPDEYNGEGRERINPDFSRKSNDAAFGPVADYARAMDTWRATYRYDGPVLAMFAGADRAVRPEDMWDTATEAPETQVRLIERIGHQLISSDPVSRATVDQWLSERFPEGPVALSRVER